MDCSGFLILFLMFSSADSSVSWRAFFRGLLVCFMWLVEMTFYLWFAGIVVLVPSNVNGSLLFWSL